MSRLAFLPWVLVCLSLASSAPAQESVLHGRCVAVVDGDTLKVLTADKQQLRIRVAWIDAPESGQPFSYRAKEALSALVFAKKVELRPHTIDRNGRTLAMVFVDGKDAALELLKQGLVWAYEHFLPEAPEDVQRSYRAAEAAARTEHLGLWVEASPVAPWEYRKLERAKLGAK